MAMTRKEAIEELERLLSHWDDLEKGKRRFRWYSKAALDVALSALRPVTREQVEKVWRGKWIGMTDDDGCTWYECSRCEHDLDSLEEPNHFCPACGAPMTDEAVEMVMERLEGMDNGTVPCDNA